MIGWYAHHDGIGHLSRAAAVIPRLEDVTLFTSRPPDGIDVPTVPLPLDVEPPCSAWTAAQPMPQVLHYAPLGVPGLRARMGTIAAWMAEAGPAAFVVDVSVEVVMLARLLSVPTIAVRQHGRRDDVPHQAAYDSASLLLAPYSEWLEDHWVDADLRARTTYTGGFSRFDGRERQGEAARRELGLDPDQQVVVVMPGAGGQTGWPVDDAAAATPGWRWVLVGDLPATSAVHSVGWVRDPWPWLTAADVVVTHAGHNAVMEAAAARTPTVVIPHDRPFDEQGHKARLLQEHAVCTVAPRWPGPDAWPALLEGTRDRGTRGLERLVDGDGACRAAAAISRLAEQAGGDA